MPTVEEVARSLQNFGWTDYTVFALMLVSCLAVGAYFSHQDKRNRKLRLTQRRGSEALDYLVGGRKMSLIPVSVSLIASLISGIGLLGNSTEIYMFGSHYVFFFISLPMTALTMHYLLLPVFHELRLTSLYEYLDRRFDRSLRLFGSVTYLLSTFLKIPIMIYVPALAFNQVTGVDIYVTTPIVCVICIFYTCVGGLKAVVWTDVIQGCVMLGSLIIVAAKATWDVGGIGVVIERNLNSTRLEAPTFNLDPTIRTSMWSAVIGGWIFYCGTIGIEQSMVQRYVSLPTLRMARQAAWIFAAGCCLIFAVAVYNGFLLHAKYHDCDPLTTGLVKRKDQLVPLLVMETMGEYPILSGCFVAGVFSASLSSLSTGLNSMTAVILEDFIKLAYGDRLTERSTAYIMRGTVVAIGVITTCLVFIVEKLGPVLALAISLAGVTYGPLLGVFVVGLSMPWIGARQTLTGAVAGLVLSGWIVFKSQADIALGTLSYATKPVQTDGCLYTFNATVTVTAVESEKSFYHLSYFYYCLFGALVTVLTANLACLVLGMQDSSEVDLELLTPPVRRFFRGKEKQIPLKEIKNGVYVPESEELAAC